MSGVPAASFASGLQARARHATGSRQAGINQPEDREARKTTENNAIAATTLQQTGTNKETGSGVECRVQGGGSSFKVNRHHTVACNAFARDDVLLFEKPVSNRAADIMRDEEADAVEYASPSSFCIVRHRHCDLDIANGDITLTSGMNCSVGHD